MIHYDPLMTHRDPPGARRRVLCAAAVAALMAALAGDSIAQAPTAPASGESPVYNIELIVFRVAAGAGSSEDWTVPPPGPPRGGEGGDNAAGAAVIGRFVGAIPPAQFQLNDLKARLGASGAYQPIAHVAWSQTASSWGSRAGFTLPRLGVNVPGLSGLVYLERGSFLHLGVSLKYAPDTRGPAYAFHELRRVRFFERNYYDHPAFGAIALVTPVQGARPAGR